MYEAPSIVDFGTVEDVTLGLGTTAADLPLGSATPSPGA